MSNEYMKKKLRLRKKMKGQPPTSKQIQLADGIASRLGMSLEDAKRKFCIPTDGDRADMSDLLGMLFDAERR